MLKDQHAAGLPQWLLPLFWLLLLLLLFLLVLVLVILRLLILISPLLCAGDVNLRCRLWPQRHALPRDCPQHVGQRLR